MHLFCVTNQPIYVEVLPLEGTPELVLQVFALRRDELEVFVRTIRFHNFVVKWRKLSQVLLGL